MEPSFLADENLPRACILALRSLGYDVASVVDTAASIDDLGVCDLAEAQGRVVVTCDKDFGELVVRWGRALPGVILLRMNGVLPQEMADLLVTALGQGHRWLHIRPLPQKS